MPKPGLTQLFRLTSCNRDQFASYAGVAPIEHSSEGRVVHRLSRRGNRQLNHAIHMVAFCQIRQKDSEAGPTSSGRWRRTRPSGKPSVH
jgi:transposase